MTANEIILQQTKLDLNFVASGLTGDDKRAVEHMQYWIDTVFQNHYEPSFNGNWDKKWQSLAKLADNEF